MQTRTASLFLIVLILHFLLIPSFGSPELSDTITFSATTYADPYEVQLDFKVGIDVTLPSELPSEQSRDVTIDIWQDWTTVTSEYEPFLPQEKMFLTPLGDSSRIHIATFVGELRYYIQLTNASVLLEINIEGNGTASHSSLLWDSAGSKSFTVSNTGSTSSEEMLTLRMAFKYVGSLTVLTIGEYGIVIDEKVKEIEASGDQIIFGNLETVPQQLEEPEDSGTTTGAYPTELLIGLAFVVVVIACAIAFALGRASKKTKQ